MVDPRGRVLLIFRRGYWDLPKGKLELGETIEQCAVREVEEECGVSGLEVLRSVGTTEHTYFEADTEILKRTHWYMMGCAGGRLVPQTQEDIELAEWVTLDELRERLAGAYPTIRELLIRVFGNV